MTQAMLSVRNLTTSFGDGDAWRPVLRDISFDVKPREAVAIVGESGSGKSVTALSIMRLLDRRAARLEGSIELDGENILALSEARMRTVRGGRIAMIFQEPMTSLNPVMTIGDQIAEGVCRHRGLQGEAAMKEASRLLDKVRIPAAAARLRDYPHNFSGGMRQRVMIAMALAGGPELLIADEPTTALDVTVQAQILDLIRSLQQEDGMSVLFITHDMGVVAEIADRTVVMYRGDIVETGDTAHLFARPAQAYTRALLAAVPRLGAKMEEAGPMRFATAPSGLSPVLDVRNLSVRFDVRSGLFGRVRGRVHAVENVSFSVRAGETLSLVGESGCGKSTTGRSILQLVEAEAGEILLEGEDLRGMNAAVLRERRRGLQMVFQDPFASLNPKMRVGLSIMEPLLIHGLAGEAEARIKAQELLERVGLQAAMMERFPHEFSGGERQRICIARALALSPKLIVADESVSALDVTIKAQVVNLLLDLQERLGLAYLFISHDMAVVERVSHRVAVMYMGEIVEIGPRAGVFGNPRHPYTRKLLAAVPVADPSHRRRHPIPAENDLRSPLRALDYRPPPRRYVEVGPGHLVQDFADASEGGSDQIMVPPHVVDR